MKIPDTIHVHGTSAPELDVKLPYHIEYTRTDAFIEKACEWLEDNLINYWGQLNANQTEGFIEKFKKAMM